LWQVEIAELKRRQKSEHGLDKFVGNGKEEHTPYLTISGSKAIVVVGCGVQGNYFHFHPMKASEDPDEVQYVTHIYVVDQTGECVAMKHLDPVSEDKVQMTFDIPPSATTLTPYEYSNKQGLWEGPEVTVPQITPMANRQRPVHPILNPDAWKYIIADLYRQHKKDHKKAEAFEGSDKEKHVPYLAFHGDKMRVTVGNDNAYHVMKDSTDPEGVHYVTYLYVLDQDNNCVAMEAPDPTGVERCVVEFAIPKGATKLTPYEYCNLHGLWVGPSLNVALMARDQNHHRTL
jgi:desulfoferrodoxin (superoxide reductase-like protein)